MNAVLISLLCTIGKLGEGDASLEANGNLRLLGGFLHQRPNPDGPAFTDGGIGLLVGRLLLDGHLPAFDYDANLFFDFQAADFQAGSGGAAVNAFSTTSSFVTPYRTPYLQWAYWQAGSVVAHLGVDRLRVHKNFGAFDLDLGRFPVNHSVTFLFTPNDFFAPFSATTLNRQYKPGVDAARMRFGLGEDANLEVLGVLGSTGSTTQGTPTWAKSAVTLRADLTAANFHWAATGGKLAGRWIVGGSLQGDIGGVSVRGEGHAGFPDVTGDFRRDGSVYGRAAARVEYGWTWHNTNIGAEYAFFSDGAARPADYVARVARFFPDDVPYLGRHYAAFNASLELIPILTLGALGMINVEDASGIATLTLAYNASNEVDIVAGLLAGWGTLPTTAADGTIVLNSELGVAPIAVFVEARVAF